MVAAAAMLALLGSSVAAAAGSSPTPASTARWQQAMRELRAPGKGCFTGSYPLVQWRRTECSTAPDRRYLPRSASAKSGPQTVGDGFDYSAVTSKPLSSVTGSFDSITPGTTETGQQNGTGGQVANTFSLQLNSEFFSSPVCSGSPSPSGCYGWEQFVYSTTYNGIFIQYWLIDYNTTCPSGWAAYSPGGGDTDCYTNSPGEELPSADALTVQELPTVSVTAKASASGDSLTLTAAGKTYTVSTGNKIDLYAYWRSAEWTIVGDGDGTEAHFSSGTTLILRSTLNDGNANLIPSCELPGGYTGETNNLHLPAGPGLGEDTLQAGETSSASTSSPSCGDAYPIGQEPGSGVAVRTGNPVGEADLVTEGANHSLQYYWATPGGSWDHAQIAGAGTTYSAPSIFVRAVDPAGEADIVAEGANHTLQYYWATPGGSWHHTQIGGTDSTYSAPSIFVRSVDPEGEADIVAEGKNNTLQYYWATPGSAWNHGQIGGTDSTYSAPSIFVRSVDPEGEADIVAEGKSNTLQYYDATPGSAWHQSQVAGTDTTYSAPSIFVRSVDPEGEADIVAEGKTNTLQYYEATPDSSWAHAQVGGSDSTYSAPSIFVRAVDPEGEADIVAEGKSNTLQYYWATPGSSWSHAQIGGTSSIFAGPSLFVRAVDPEGEADIVAEGSSNTLQYYWATPGSAWRRVQVAGSGTTFSG